MLQRIWGLLLNVYQWPSLSFPSHVFLSSPFISYLMSYFAFWLFLNGKFNDICICFHSYSFPSIWFFCLLFRFICFHLCIFILLIFQFSYIFLSHLSCFPLIFSTFIYDLFFPFFAVFFSSYLSSFCDSFLCLQPFYLFSYVSTQPSIVFLLLCDSISLVYFKGYRPAFSLKSPDWSFCKDPSKGWRLQISLYVQAWEIYALLSAQIHI